MDKYPVQNMYYNFVNMPDYMNRLKLTTPTWEYFLYFKDFMDIKVSMFTYEGLPKDLTSEILETALLLYNNLCLYKPNGLEDVVLGYYTWNSDMNIYLKPKFVNIMSFNGKVLASNVPFEEIVLVRDNAIDIIPFITLNTWIEKIWNIDKTLDIALKWIRFPKMLEGTKEQSESIKKVVEQAYEYKPVVIVRKGFTKDVFPDHDMTLPVHLMEIYDIREKYRGLALASIGIYNVTEKRERDVAAVTAVNVDYQNFTYQEMYHQRKDFVKRCNEKFGTKIVLHEAYVDNRKEDADLKADETRKEEKAKVEEQIKLEEAKSDGDSIHKTL